MAFAAVVLVMSGCSDEGGDTGDTAAEDAADTTTAGSDTDMDTLRLRAAEVTELITANKWAEVRVDFDETMKNGLSEQQLADAWNQVVAAKGAYLSHGEPQQVLKPGAFAVFDTPLSFANGPMKTRVAFSEDGKIAGLFILVPEAL